MRDLSWKAKGYISLVLAAGVVVFSLSLPKIRGENIWPLLLAILFGCAAQILKVEGQTHKSSYNLGWMVFGFALVILGSPEALFVILVAHLIEWIWHRFPWFIQSFNIATYAISVAAATAANLIILGLAPESSLFQVAGILAGFAAFTIVNHLLVGFVIYTARGESFAESGVFSFLTLMIDFALLCMGAAAALVWALNPFAVLLTIFPLYLLYNTLKVPSLEQQTKIDEKTGLYNAAYFAEVLERELTRAEQFDRPLTVVLGDMDLLRNINNTYGHLAGDEVLKGVAQILQASARAHDLVARFGGEEFAILMPESTPEDAYPYIEAIRFAIQDAEFEVETSITPIQCSLSFGIAGRQTAQITAKELVHNADVALYHAKLTGRNTTSIYSDRGLEELFKISTEEGSQVSGGVPDTAIRGNILPYQPSPFRSIPPAAEVEEGEERSSVAASQSTVRPAWLLNGFVMGLALAACGLTWLLLGSAPMVDLSAIILLAFIAVLTELMAIDIYSRDTSVSTAVAPFVAGVLLFGPLAAVLLSVSLAVAAWVKHRSPFKRVVFNASNHLLGGLMAFGFLALTRVDIGEHQTWIQLALALIASGIVYLMTTSMVSTAIGMDTGLPIRQLWEERFLWLSPYYLALGCISFLMVTSYIQASLLGLLVAIVPLLMLRFVQSQYLERTKGAVGKLKELNHELSQQTEAVGVLSEELLMTLAKVIDLRDPFVYGHSEQVTRYSTMIARELGLDAEQTELIRKAGMLHDIGKIAIPETILLKEGSLTDEEYEIVMQHPGVGAQLLESCHSLHALIPIVRHHHERFDGLGYPDGIGGQAVPLGARILAMADSVDAMASDRPYRMALNPEQIMDEVRENSGTQFDPEVATAFIRILNREGSSILLNSARKVAARQFGPLSISSMPTEMVLTFRSPGSAADH